jgi:CRISPR-associated protein Cmr6
MIRGLEDAAKKLGISTENVNLPKKTSQVNTNTNSQPEIIIEQIPMMYRAQVSGRCSLQFAGNNQDLEQWRDEWIYPNSNNDRRQPRYQHKEPNLGLEGEIYRIKIEFPFRLLSNCGQDSIIRPMLGKNGIPFIPGSSIKGIFRRACTPEQAIKYCGDNQQLVPGTLRFHRAYPIGDWAGTRQVSIRRNRQVFTETRYRIVDVIHPQQPRQVEGHTSPTALASISFYQPTCIFELSSSDRDINWQEVEGILLKSLQNGVGGKTSTGYGLGGHTPNKFPEIPDYPLNIGFKGFGVSPLLRSDEPEFRPNVFKATLRGHVRRLLGGVCNQNSPITQAENRFFGSSEAPGIVSIFWEVRKENYNIQDLTPTFDAEGILHINASSTELPFLQQVLKFAFIMGGFGKSWRRVSHKKFYPNYPKLAQGLHIGCHWECLDSNWLDIKTTAKLQGFLNDLYETCKNRLGTKPPQAMGWREAWSPKRVAVYSKVVNKSLAVELFHDSTFKTTPAIGGRNPDDKRPTSVSSVWHRMLPIDNNQYLEIVTVFHGDRTPWRHRTQADQLQPFIKSLKQKGLQLSWGEEPQ